jgi:hypothetical protein
MSLYDRVRLGHSRGDERKEGGSGRKEVERKRRKKERGQDESE